MEKHNWWFYDQKKERTAVSISIRECFRLSLCKLKGAGWAREITNCWEDHLRFNFYHNLINSSNRFHKSTMTSQRQNDENYKTINETRIVKVEHKMNIMTGKLSVRSVWGRNDAKMLAAGAQQIPSRKLKKLSFDWVSLSMKTKKNWIHNRPLVNHLDDLFEFLFAASSID